MRAVRYAEPGTIEIAEVGEPVLSPGGIVVSTAFAGICGSDIRSWRHGNARLKGPQVLGHEVSGTVTRSAADEFPVGSRVTVCPGMSCQRCEMCQRGGAVWCPNRRSLGYDLPGGMAERFALPSQAIELGCVVSVPDGLSLRAASLAEPLHTVINGQDRAGIDSNDSVLVIGLGPIGTLHTVVARSRGATPVIGLDMNAERVAAAARILGPDHLHSAPDDPGLVRSWAPRDGWDVVILAAGAASAVELALEVVAPGGRVLAFAGMPADRSVVPIDLNRIHYRQLNLVGAFGGSPRTFRRAVRWLADSTLPLEEFVTSTVSLLDGVHGFELCEKGVGLKTSIAVSDAGGN